MRILSLKEAAELLAKQPYQKNGRTLPFDKEWCGHDVPGRGQAAARRLRQIAKREHNGLNTVTPTVEATTQTSGTIDEAIIQAVVATVNASDIFDQSGTTRSDVGAADG